MKTLFLLPLFILALKAYATDYYVSSSGSDTNNGTSTSTPWKTIAKLNSITLKPGDNVFFNRGEVFYGGINLKQSGTLGFPITFGAYGSGAKPVVSGFTTVSSWNSLGGNIWESTNSISTLSYTNMVKVNGMERNFL